MNTRDDVLELVERSEDPRRPSQVASRLPLPYDRAQKAMQRLARAGDLVTDGGGTYTIPDRDVSTEPRDNGPRVLVLRDAWEDPPATPRHIERNLSGY